MFFSKTSVFFFLSVLIFLLLILGCDRLPSEEANFLSIQQSPVNIKGKEVALSEKTAPLSFPLPPFVKHRNVIPDTILLNSRNVFTLKADERKLQNFPEPVYQNADQINQPSNLAFTKEKLSVTIPQKVMAKDGIMKQDNPFSFSFFTQNQGLAQDDISSITFDDNGAIWLGTYGAGLVGYDGKYFLNFAVENGLSDNFILDVLFDSRGRLLMGTRSAGLMFYDGNDFEKLQIDSIIPDLRIEKIFEDSRGNIWLGTFGNGAYKLTDSTLVNYLWGQGLEAKTVYDITEDQNGTLWFATRENGIYAFDGEAFRQYTVEQGLPENFITAIDFDLEGNLWMGTRSSGIVVFDGAVFHYFNEKNGFPEDEITTIYAGKSGDIFIGTRYSGYIRYSAPGFMQYSYNEGLINSFITDIREDLSGKLWLGTYGGGLAAYFGDVFKHFNESTGIPDVNIRAIFQDSDGNKWFGTNASGAFILKNDYLLHFHRKTGLAENSIREIYEDLDKNIWFGLVNGGVSVYNGSNMMSFPKESILSEITVLTILQQQDKVLWLGSYGDGLFKIDGDSITQFTTENGLSDNYIRKLVEDKLGNLWIATQNGGVIKFDGNSFTQFTIEQGLPVNDIFDILVDKKNNIWLSTNGSGVIVFPADTMFFNLTERQGLKSNYVYSILKDDKDNIWFGTRWGLSKLINKNMVFNNSDFRNENPSQAYQMGIFFKNYQYSDGFMGIGVNTRAMYQDIDGIIWIGSNEILTSLNTANIYSATVKPKAYLNWVGLFNEYINWADIIDKQDTIIRLSSGVLMKNFTLESLNPWTNTPTNLSLAYNNNYLGFNFSAINSDLSPNLQYVYYLEGHDNTWSSLTPQSEVHYGNLSSGKYRFVLKAMNNEGIFSDEISFPFKITYPWWQRWWAFTFYLIVLAGMWYMYKRYIENQQKKKEEKKQEELQLHQEIEIARKSAEFKQKFLANMSHEIRTPLTGILGMAELMQKTRLDIVQEDYLKTLILSGENLRETINLVLDYSKIEAGKIVLNQSIFPFQLLFLNAEKLFFSLNNKKLLLEKYIAPDIPLYVKTDYNRIFQILSNLISNAVKFTDTGKISLNASLDQSVNVENSLLIKISVKDTGQGIPEDKKQKLFKPFYQVDQSFDSSYDGTGLGLAICKELSSILGGSVGVESKKGKGSTFWFTFKVEEAENDQTTENRVAESDRYSQKQLRILLVEDQQINQKVISLMLSALKHRVVIAENGEKALELFKPELFDLILMDIQMPVMDGVTATNILKNTYKNLPPLVGLSANAIEGDREKYMSLGLDDYITKPVKQNDFINIINKLKLNS